MKTLKYGVIMPRVAIEKLKLIRTDDLLDLVGKSLEVIYDSLLETAYQDEIREISKDEIDMISIEEALLENYAKTLENLVKFSVGEVKDVLLAIIEKIEISNIKTLLRAAKAKMNANEAVRRVVSVGRLNKERCREILLTSPTVEGIIQALSDLENGRIMKGLLSEIQPTENLSKLELSLDRVASLRILEAVEKLKGADRKIAENILGIEMDAANIKIILRGKKRGTPKDQLKMYFMPSFLLDDKILEKAIESSDIKSLAEYLIGVALKANNPYYKSVFSQLLRESNSSFSKIEAILDTASLGISLRMVKKYFKYYNMSYILSFLNLKWFEIRNLRCIIVGSDRKTTPVKIKSLLVLK